MSATSLKADVLVSTEWVHQHRTDKNLRIVESDEDLLLYEQGHIREAVEIDWQTDLQDQTSATIITKDSFAELVRAQGHLERHHGCFLRRQEATGGPATPFGRSSCSVTSSA